jgi:hypothetical protein
MTRYKIKTYRTKQEYNFGLGIDFWRQSKRMSTTEREWDLSITIGHYYFGIAKEELF